MRYNVFEDAYDLAEKMIDLAVEDDVMAIVNFEEARDLVQALAENGCLTIMDIELCSPEIDGYDKEYFVTVTNDGYLWCERAWHETNEYHEAGYLRYGEKLCYIHEECNSVLIQYALENTEFVEFAYANDDEEYQSCTDCPDRDYCENVTEDTGKKEEVLNELSQVLDIFEQLTDILSNIAHKAVE